MGNTVTVTIEGVHPGSPALGAKERVTVTRTQMVDNLLRQGFARVVEDAPTPADARDVDGGSAADAEREDDGGAAADSEQGADGAPTKRASRQAWRDHLDAIGIPWHEDMSRAELIALTED